MGMNLRLITVLALAAMLAGCGSQPGKRQLVKGREALEGGDYVIAKTWLENTINETTDSEIKARAYNLLGVACWRIEDLQAAVEAFESAREIDPGLQNAAYNLALVALEKGNDSRAVSLMEEAAMIDSDDTRPLQHLGMLYMEEGRWADARRTFLDALEDARGSPRILTALGLAEFYLERPQSAREYWERALENDENYAPALYNLAFTALAREGETGRGREYADRFLEVEPSGKKPNQIRDLIAMDNAKAEGGVGQDAGPAADERSETGESREEPTDILEQARIQRRKGASGHALNLCLQEAMRAKREGDQERQLQALQTAANICFDQARSHYALGRYYLENDQPEKAMKSLKQATAIRPQWARAQTGLAQASIELENYDTAIVALKQALQAEENNAEALWTLAQLYDKHLEREEDAVDAYEKFSKLFPGDPRVLTAQDRLKELNHKNTSEKREDADSAEPPLEEPRSERSRPSSRRSDRGAAVAAFNKGVQAHRREDWVAAIQHYRKAIEQDSSFVRPHFNLGLVYGIEGRGDAAEQEYAKTLDLAPEHTNARFNLALLYYNREEYSKAARQLKLLLRQESSHAKANFLLGLIYAEHSDNTAKAKEYYRRYLQLDPQDQNAPKVRAWINKN